MAAAASMTNALRAMSVNELHALRELIAKEETHRKVEIEDTFGKAFCNIVGIDRIFSLKKVEAKDLNLQSDAKYPQRCAKPSMMKDVSAVYGIMESNRPFIGIKVEIVDPKLNKVVGVVVEVVFKRYSLHGAGGKGCLHENNYVTAIANETDDGKRFPSCLYGSELYGNGGMRDSQITAVRDLLEGSQVEALSGPKYLVRMVK